MQHPALVSPGSRQPDESRPSLLPPFNSAEPGRHLRDMGGIQPTAQDKIPLFPYKQCFPQQIVAAQTHVCSTTTIHVFDFSVHHN